MFSLRRLKRYIAILRQLSSVFSLTSVFNKKNPTARSRGRLRGKVLTFRRLRRRFLRSASYSEPLMGTRISIYSKRINVELRKILIITPQ